MEGRAPRGVQQRRGDGHGRRQAAGVASTLHSHSRLFYPTQTICTCPKRSTTRTAGDSHSQPNAQPETSTDKLQVLTCQRRIPTGTTDLRVVSSLGPPQTLGHNTQVPYLSEENHDEDPELRVTASKTGPDADAIRAFVAERGRPVVHAALRTLVAEIHVGGPQQGGAGDAAAAPAEAAPAEAVAAAKQPPVAPAAAPAQPKKQQPKAPKSYTSLRLQETFQAAPRDLYECFTDARRVMAFTQVRMPRVSAAGSSPCG